MRLITAQRRHEPGFRASFRPGAEDVLAHVVMRPLRRRHQLRQIEVGRGRLALSQPVASSLGLHLDIAQHLAQIVMQLPGQVFPL
jgi:hypothetical protein